MDRTLIASGAAVVLGLLAGCDAQPSILPQASKPTVLAELQALEAAPQIPVARHETRRGRRAVDARVASASEPVAIRSHDDFPTPTMPLAPGEQPPASQEGDATVRFSLPSLAPQPAPRTPGGRLNAAPIEAAGATPPAPPAPAASPAPAPTPAAIPPGSVSLKITVPTMVPKPETKTAAPAPAAPVRRPVVARTPAFVAAAPTPAQGAPVSPELAPPAPVELPTDLTSKAPAKVEIAEPAEAVPQADIAPQPEEVAVKEAPVEQALPARPFEPVVPPVSEFAAPVRRPAGEVVAKPAPAMKKVDEGPAESRLQAVTVEPVASNFEQELEPQAAPLLAQTNAPRALQATPEPTPAEVPHAAAMQPTQATRARIQHAPAPAIERSPTLAARRQESLDVAPAANSEPSEMPLAKAQPSAEMAAVCKRAEDRVGHGFQLAQRNATYSARSEFVAALELISQALDAQQNTQTYSKSLTAGLAALREGGDFLRASSGAKEVDLARTIKGHKTTLLRDVPLEGITPFAAAQRYYTFAQEQLAAAVAHEPAASWAYYGMGKLAILPTESDHTKRLENTAQAMALYQASLVTDARNFRAANELGVILAQNGDLARARDLLIHSIRLSQQSSTFHNLAVVYGRLGEKQAAEQAEAQCVALENSGQKRSGPNIQLVDPVTFASMAPASDVPLPPAPMKAAPNASQARPASAMTPTSETQPAGTMAKRGLGDFLPWTRR